MIGCSDFLIYVTQKGTLSGLDSIFLLSFKILFKLSAYWGVGPIQGLFSVHYMSLGSPELPFLSMALISFQFFSSLTCSAPIQCWLEQFPSRPLSLAPLELTCSPEISQDTLTRPFSLLCTHLQYKCVCNCQRRAGAWRFVTLPGPFRVNYSLSFTRGPHSLCNCTEVTFCYIWYTHADMP